MPATLMLLLLAAPEGFLSGWTVWVSPLDAVIGVGERDGGGFSAGWAYRLSDEVELRGAWVVNRLVALNSAPGAPALEQPRYELDLLDVAVGLPLAGGVSVYAFGGLGVLEPLVPKANLGVGAGLDLGGGFGLALEAGVDAYFGVETWRAYGAGDGYYDSLFHSYDTASGSGASAERAEVTVACARADAGRNGLCYVRTDPGFYTVANPRLLVRYRF